MIIIVMIVTFSTMITIRSIKLSFGNGDLVKSDKFEYFGLIH